MTYRTPDDTGRCVGRQSIPNLLRDAVLATLIEWCLRAMTTEGQASLSRIMRERP